MGVTTSLQELAAEGFVRLQVLATFGATGGGVCHLASKENPCTSVRSVLLLSRVLLPWPSAPAVGPAPPPRPTPVLPEPALPPPRPASRRRPTGTAAPVRDTNVDLVIWTDADRSKAVQKYADEFAAENGVTVKVQIATDTRTQFKDATKVGKGPDVIVGAHDWLGELVQNSTVAPINLSADVSGEVPARRPSRRRSSTASPTACPTPSRTSASCTTRTSSRPRPRPWTSSSPWARSSSRRARPRASCRSSSPRSATPTSPTPTSRPSPRAASSRSSRTATTTPTRSSSTPPTPSRVARCSPRSARRRSSRRTSTTRTRTRSSTRRPSRS